MSFMPTPGSIVRLKDGRIAVVTEVTPGGDRDRVWTGAVEECVSPSDIAEILHEPESEPCDPVTPACPRPRKPQPPKGADA